MKSLIHKSQQLDTICSLHPTQVHRKGSVIKTASVPKGHNLRDAIQGTQLIYLHEAAWQINHDRLQSDRTVVTWRKDCFSTLDSNKLRLCLFSLFTSWFLITQIKYDFWFSELQITAHSFGAVALMMLDENPLHATCLVFMTCSWQACVKL